MSILDKITRYLFPPRPTSRYFHFKAKCKRCGEILEGKVDLYNEPSENYESDQPTYFCRKVLVGGGPCYQPVEVTFKFDEKRNVLEKKIIGGEFAD